MRGGTAWHLPPPAFSSPASLSSWYTASITFEWGAPTAIIQPTSDRVSTTNSFLYEERVAILAGAHQRCKGQWAVLSPRPPHSASAAAPAPAAGHGAMCAVRGSWPLTTRIYHTAALRGICGRAGAHCAQHLACARYHDAIRCAFAQPTLRSRAPSGEKSGRNTKS